MSISDYPVGTKFIPVRKWAKENDVPERTAYRWAHAGKLESLVLGPKAFVIVERPEAAMA